MTKRRLTADDKKSLMVKFLQDRKEFFTLKELEKVVPKETGMNEKMIKDVLQQVLDDGLVDSEKVGNQTVYWSFPNKGLKDMERKCAKLNEKLTEVDKKIAEIQEKKAKNGNHDEVGVLTTEHDLLKTKVVMLGQNVKKAEAKQTSEQTLKDLEFKKEWTPVRSSAFKHCNVSLIFFAFLHRNYVMLLIVGLITCLT